MKIPETNTIGFQLHAILSSVMKSHAILPDESPFVLCIHYLPIESEKVMVTANSLQLQRKTVGRL